MRFSWLNSFSCLGRRMIGGRRIRRVRIGGGGGENKEEKEEEEEDEEKGGMYTIHVRRPVANQENA